MSTALDARALAGLDELLTLAEAQREHRLSQWQCSDPALHARICALWRAAEMTEASRRLADVAGAGWAGPAPGWSQGQQVGGYRLLRELGQGGMSRVWLAERLEGGLTRPVALKLPLVAGRAGELAERFAQERELLAALDHPNIARLYDAGVTADHHPYLVLEFVDGLPLTEHALRQGLGMAARLALFGQVLAAVQHAHAHMVVHRDLKPGNILVDAQGQVKLLDFGIAKLLAPQAGAHLLTRPAGPLLTPRYAAPEQIGGLPVTAATDVYSAGVVLYELLTGRHPQVGSEAPAMGALLHAVLHQPPRPPGMGRDLDTILLKALAKSPADRYASAERMAEDLRRFQAHEPILARRVSMGRRLMLLGQRWPRATVVAALASSLLAASLALAWQQRQASTAQAARAAAVRDFMYDMVSDAEAEEGRQQGEVTGADMVRAALRRARQDFSAQPLLQGELLGELGRMAARLGQPDEARRALVEAIERLQGQVPTDHPPLNKARAHLAGRLLGQDDARAQALARQVLADCTDPRPDCAKARAYAHDVLMLWHSQ